MLGVSAAHTHRCSHFSNCVTSGGNGVGEGAARAAAAIPNPDPNPSPSPNFIGKCCMLGMHAAHTHRCSHFLNRTTSGGNRGGEGAARAAARA